MKGHKPATPRILKFCRTLVSSKRKKRVKAWLQLVVFILVVTHPTIHKVFLWYLANYSPLEAVLTLISTCQTFILVWYVRRDK